MQEKHKPEFFFWNKCSTCQEQHLMSGLWSVDEMTDQQRESDKGLMRCALCSQKSIWNKNEGNGGKKDRKTKGERKELLSELLWWACGRAGMQSVIEKFQKVCDSRANGVKWTHLEQVYLPLQSSAVQPLFCNIWGILCIYLAWHQPGIALSTLKTHPNVQPTASRARSRDCST